jgi:2-polyprenyl-6-methoxyphenol hydroxylase-like FAD-dependent oxidoreductase
MANIPVLIIGAGPTGMTAAIELRRAGLEVRVIDKSTHLARWSQALVVQARTLEQFQRYGIAQAAVSRGRKLIGARTFSDGKQIVHFQFDQVPSRYPFLLFLPQSETEALLNEHMESLGVKAERAVELTSLTPRSDGVVATLQHPDGKTEEVTANWVIGCDGAHSLVRERSGIPFEGHGIQLRFSLGDFEVEGPDKPVDELVVHLHHGDVIFSAPLSEKLTRVIVAKHAEAAGGEGWTTPDGELAIRDFQQALDDAGVRIRLLGAEWMTPFHVNDRQAERYRAGNIFLAGDASHIHSPIGGQGMNTGIQDAANLCWKIAAAERGSEAREQLLDSYQTERAEVGRALLAATERVLKLTTTESSLAMKARDLLAPHITELSPVQRAISGFISETAIEYRSSPVVSDHGGDGSLHAGDRMPDISLAGFASRSVTILGSWTSGKHLGVAVNATEGQVAELKTALTEVDLLPIAAANVGEEGRRLLGDKPSLLLVRPDGYIGFRGPLDKSDQWRAYARQDAL